MRLPHVVPALIAATGERASLRFLAFFAVVIRTPHPRRAYSRAAAEFMVWCDDQRMTAVRPLHVAAWIEMQTSEHAASTVRLRLAALRHIGSKFHADPQHERTIAKMGSLPLYRRARTLLAEFLPLGNHRPWRPPGNEPA